MSWAVTHEAVQAMNNLSQSLEEIATRIHSEVDQLKQVYETEKDGLGAHSGDIQALLDDVGAAEEEASRPVKKLVLKLTRAAAIRMSHIETQRYSGRSR